MGEIFPDKLTPVERTVVGEAAALLSLLGPRSVSIGQLYVEHRQRDNSASYDSYAAALSLLYGAGVLGLQGQILRVS